MRIPIKTVREFARKHKLTHAIVFGYDGNKQHVATYGESVEQCAQAADFGNKLKKALGWPESLQAQPARVRALQKEIACLKNEVSRLKAVLADERGELK
jgi:uncharacterized small protein (DUF1192 family)